MMPQKLQMIQRYFLINKHINIPRSFIVPRYTDDDPEQRMEANNWPIDMQGARLGGMIFSIKKMGIHQLKAKYPSEYNILESMEFCWKKERYTFPEKVQMMKYFHMINGHIQVPIEFVVPSNDSNWPVQFANAMLGTIAQGILRRQWHFRSRYPKEFQMLVDLGYATKTTIKTSKYLSLFQKFYELHGHVNIPQRYTIQENDSRPVKEVKICKFGCIASHIKRNGKKFIEQKYSNLFDELRNLNFSWKRKSKAMLISNKMKLLDNFYNVYNHLDIRSKSELPVNASNWEEEYYGATLRNIANSLRFRNEEYLKAHHPDYYQQLTNRGFSWKPTRKGKIKFSTLKSLEMLKHFYILHNHSDVSSGFIVPSNHSHWPEHYWGQKLGLKVSWIRQKGRDFYYDRDSALVQELDGMKFRWDTKVMMRYDFKMNLIQLYFQKYGNLSNIDKSFVVQLDDDSWPKQYRGLAVGKILSDLKPRISKKSKKILTKKTYSRKSKLNIEKEWLPVIKKYYALHQNLNMKWNYITPCNSSWPNRLQNSALGRFLTNIRYKGEEYYKREHPLLHKTLIQYQFRWQPKDSMKPFPEKVEILKKYYEINGHLNGLSNFVIPRDHENWPQCYQGIRLGIMVSTIRSKGRSYYAKKYPNECDELENLGFVWRMKLILSFEERVKLFSLYYKVHGHLYIPTSYSIPHNSTSWNSNYWGVKLGMMFYNLQRSPQREIYQQAYPLLCNELEHMQFKWIIQEKK